MSWAGQIIRIEIPVLGERDSDGVQVLLGFVAGYHLNTNAATRDLLLANDAEFAAHIISPTTPHCIWAGDPEDTICLYFADEAEARASVVGDYWRSEQIQAE